MAQRAVWTGMVSFGLVNVPVKLYTAVTPHKVKFHQVNSKTGARIRQKRVDEGTNAEVPYDEIVKGYEIAPDQYVTITAHELDHLAPEKTKQITLERFIEASEIDPVSFEASYNVAPDKGGAHAYILLTRAMERTNKVGVGRFVLRNTERLVAIRAAGGHLTLSTLVFASELNDPDKLPEMDQTSIEVVPAELDMAQTLIENFTEPFDHAAFADEYTAAVRELIEKKAAGEEVVIPATAAAAPAGDLMSALEASLMEVKSGKAKV